ncbi:hypothetical protein Ddye_026066 [Dipteronia dyeriana]|uniref:Histone-lysine N-methyltransferase SUVR3 n=1 Tax=Dipteronia dyeriana TaxID=168575 RepID=A0AAD9TM14_9ROSI|nr:hypothetical protein Ddye_026066 [Dipteronia dyeriana]
MNNTHHQKMCEQPPRHRHKKTTDEEKQSRLCLCAHLILPWLTPLELANASLTCKTLLKISKSITNHRSLHASRSFENLPIPFHNTLDNIPYAYFIYIPSQIIASSSSHSLQRQFWGPSSAAREPYSATQLDPESVGRLIQEIGNNYGSELVSANDDVDLGSMSRGPSRLSQLYVDSVCVVDESDETMSGCECEECFDMGDEIFGCPCFSELEKLGIVSECGPSCECGLGCGNRLTQRGISVRLKIMRDVNKGWGLFADQLLRQGQFVCEYAGELLTTKEARRRQQIYDEIASHGGISSALLVIREHLPSGKACLRINIDATRVGNVARFINHSCDGGNLSTMLVRSSGAVLPRLCFFASKDIKEGEELNFSYGEIRVRSKGLPCFCGSSCCFGILPSEHT